MKLIKIIYYQAKTGKSPLIEWLNDLDVKTRSIIKARLDRLALGNFGDNKSIKGAQGISELRIDYGPGYRVYFGKDGAQIIILLIGGDKGSQKGDITKAKKYWETYRESL